MNQINLNQMKQDCDDFDRKIRDYSNEHRMKMYAERTTFRKININYTGENIINTEFNKNLINQVVDYIKSFDDDIFLNYNEQLYKIFDYDIKQIHVLMTQTIRDEPLFRQTIKNRSGRNDRMINCLVDSCLVNPFNFIFTDIKKRTRYIFFDFYM